MAKLLSTAFKLFHFYNRWKHNKIYHGPDVWSELSPDLIRVIINKLSLPDMIKFAWVCSSWRSSTATIRKHRLQHLLPLPGGELRIKCKKYNLKIFDPSDFKVYKLLIFKLQEWEFCGLSSTYIVLEYRNSKIKLFHLFSDVVINFHPELIKYCVWKIASSSDLSVVMAKISPQFNEYVLMFCRPNEKDTTWKTIELQNGDIILDLFYSKGNFYALGWNYINIIEGLVDGSETTSLFRKRRILLLPECYTSRQEYLMSYLVESSGDILLVICYCALECDHSNWVKVLKVDTHDSSNHQWIDNLSDCTLFLTVKHSFSLSVTEFPLCKKNCIYIMDHYPCIACYMYQYDGNERCWTKRSKLQF